MRKPLRRLKPTHRKAFAGLFLCLTGVFLASSWFPRSPDPGEIPVRVFPERSAESADTPEGKARFPSATGEAARSAERVEAKLDWPLEPGRSRLVRLAIERATEGIGSSP